MAGRALSDRPIRPCEDPDRGLAGVSLSDRQRKVVNVLLDAGPGGFEGGLSAGKYQNLTSTSRQTASRDLADLVEKGVLRATGHLKSTRYHVAVPEWQ